MHGGEWMVVLIVAIVMVAQVIKAGVKYGGRFDIRHYQQPVDRETKAENQRLRSEVEQLKERLKVLERITVEKENSLAREIESLRDR